MNRHDELIQRLAARAAGHGEEPPACLPPGTADLILAVLPGRPDVCASWTRLATRCLPVAALALLLSLWLIPRVPASSPDTVEDRWVEAIFAEELQP
jgi:hypothetical protein